MGQLCDGSHSHRSWVTKDEPFPSLLHVHVGLLLSPISHAGRRLLGFVAGVYNLLFSPSNLRGRSADHHQTLPHVQWWPRFIKFGQKFWDASPLSPKKYGGPKHQNFGDIASWWRISLEWNTVCQTENFIANSDHSGTCVLDLVNMWSTDGENRTGVSTYPTGGNHAGHCHAY